jgi:predicted  nucleic acid-binding Zn-ribbon protein
MGAHRTPVLGHIDCPACGLDMDVKKDKNQHGMGYCPDCGQQLFTRNDYRSAKLLARMRPVVAAPAPPATPAQDAQEANGGATEETPVPIKKIEPAAATPAAAALPKVRATWLAGLAPVMTKGKEQHVNGK